MNKMKNYIVVIIVLTMSMVLSENSMGQKQSFTQYYLNLPAINAGFTGIEPYLDGTTAYRQRWNNFSEKNNSFFVSAYGSIGNTSPAVFRNNALRVSRPSTYNKMARNKSVNKKHGIGGMVMARTVGPFKTINTAFNYAYHLPVTGVATLAFGARIGYNSYTIDYSDFVVRDQVNDEFYQDLINSSSGKQQQILADFGMTLYTSRFYVGLSSSQLVSKSLGGDTGLELPSSLSLDLLIGNQFDLSQNLELFPSGRITHNEIYGLTWEVNARVRYNHLIYIGALYENKVKTALLLGLTMDGRFNINYSYDYYLNDLREFSTGNHEFTLGVALFNKYSTPSRLW